MKFLASNDYEEAVRIIKREMAPYYSARNVLWNDEDKLNAYRECKLWSIEEGVNLGIAMTKVDGDQFYLAELHIDVDHRNKGYGSESLKIVSSLASRKGFEEIRVRVFKENPAYKLYLRSGYSFEKTMPYTDQLVAKTSRSEQAVND